MEQKRKYQRVPVALSATLYGAGDTPGRSCGITEVSNAGLIIEIQEKTNFRVGRNLMLEIDVPGIEKPVNALIRLKWLRPATTAKDGRTAGGAQITIMKPADKKALLAYAYEQLLKKEQAL